MTQKNAEKAAQLWYDYGPAISPVVRDGKFVPILTPFLTALEAEFDRLDGLTRSIHE